VATRCVHRAGHARRGRRAAAPASAVDERRPGTQRSLKPWIPTAKSAWPILVAPKEGDWVLSLHVTDGTSHRARSSFRPDSSGIQRFEHRRLRDAYDVRLPQALARPGTLRAQGRAEPGSGRNATGTSVAESTRMTSAFPRWLLLVPGLYTALACSDGDERRIVRTTHESEGGLCLRSSSDEALAVTVVFPTCLSSCTRELSTSCEVTRSGDQLVISSKAETETTGDDACTANCGSLVARCTAPAAVPPGPYAVSYGEDSADISLVQSPIELFAEDLPFRPCSMN
jgi:hypothetical protein